MCPDPVHFEVVLYVYATPGELLGIYLYGIESNGLSSYFSPIIQIIPTILHTVGVIVGHYITGAIIAEMIVGQPENAYGRIQALDRWRQRYVHIQQRKIDLSVTRLTLRQLFWISILDIIYLVVAIYC